MRVEDYFPEGKRWWVRLHEKGGKRQEMPAHHTLAGACEIAPVAGFTTSVGLRPPYVTHPATLSHPAAAAYYRTGENAVGISSLFSCRIGRTPVCGGHWPPGLRDASRTRARSLRSLYTQV